MKPIYFSHHVLQTAKAGKAALRLNLRFEKTWKGKYYGTKQGMAIVAELPDRFVAVTVLTFYF